MSLASAAGRLWRARFVRFAAVGAAGFVVNSAALYVALHGLRLVGDIAWFVAFLPAVTFTWWGNRSLTFHDHARRKPREMLHEWLRFLLANGFGAAVNYAVYEAVLHTAPAPLDNPFAALALGVLAGLVFNFLLSKHLVFRPAARK